MERRAPPPLPPPLPQQPSQHEHVPQLPQLGDKQAAADFIVGPNTPALQPPAAVLAASSPPKAAAAYTAANGLGNGASSLGSGCSGGALIFAGDFALQQSGVALPQQQQSARCLRL